ncbi:MAG: 5-formyltetrahydrofolate cyclo-ligase, partial [Phycisphaerales bacterium]
SSKPDLRHEAEQRLRGLTTTQQSNNASAITPHLLADPTITTASTILAYAAFGTELSLDPFISAALNRAQTIAIPAIDWATKSMAPVAITNLANDLETGRYDIRVPKPGLALVEPAQLDVILLPGLAFDRAGNRLGRGAGFYDRFISALHEAGHRPTLIGVCYHAQVVDSVPTEPHDHRVDRVITERGPLEPV